MVCYTGEGNLTVLQKVWGGFFFLLVYNGNSEAWEKRNKTYASGKENSDFADSEANFIRILG